MCKINPLTKDAEQLMSFLFDNVWALEPFVVGSGYGDALAELMTLNLVERRSLSGHDLIFIRKGESV